MWETLNNFEFPHTEEHKFTVLKGMANIMLGRIMRLTYGKEL